MKACQIIYDDVDLKTIRNRSRREVATETLSFINGEWSHCKLLCFQTEFLDLGNCECENHKIWSEEEILTGAQAWELIKKAHKEDKEDKR